MEHKRHLLLIDEIQVNELLDNTKLILNRLDGLRPTSVFEGIDEHFIPKNKFMSIAGIATTKFHSLQKAGLRTRKIGGRVYVDKTEVNRFFDGEIK